ncbi:MAG TPA: zf-HC2 domain-containing protein [Pyrinomonadaceae bacterium]|jgi:hypothetical protein
MMEKCYDEGTLQAFLDNELAPELSQRIARHMVDCDPCAILLAEVEEETAFAFAALEQEFNTLVPTQRLWTKINESIETQQRQRNVWQRLLGYASGFVSGLSFTNPQVVAFGGLLLIVGVVSTLIVVKNDTDLKTIAGVNPPVFEQPMPKIAVQQPAATTDAVTDEVNGTSPGDRRAVKVSREKTPQYRVETADFRKGAGERTSTDSRTSPVEVTPVIRAPQFVDGEESYVSTIARLEQTVNQNKDQVLKPSARFSYEKDLAVVNDTISKLRKEVRKNPKNEDAKQILFASYQNKIELLNSVTQRGELMASLR